MPQPPEKPSPTPFQPDLFPAGLPSLDLNTPQRPVAAPPREHATPRWLERLELFLRILLRMYIGIAVCYAPWSRLFWDHNPLFLHYPTLGAIAANGAVRGLVSGLGLLNLWIAYKVAVQHWEK